MTDRMEDRLEHEANLFARHPLLRAFEWGLGIFMVVAALYVVIALAVTGNVFLEAARARVAAPAEVTKRVYDPNNIINQVMFFTQTCENVGRDYANWRSNQADYSREIQLATTARTQGEVTQANNAAQQLSTAISGALQQLQNDAADYNARSINYTANPFKSANLPYRITPPTDPSSLDAWIPPQCG